MKKWLETRQVLDRLAELRSEGRRAALATVVRVRGSAYRHEGAKMLVAKDGSVVGNVSGGCLEADVREVALRVLETGVSEQREYCGSADEIEAWDLGVGCEGVVDVSVQRAALSVQGDDTWAAVRRLLDAEEGFVWCADIVAQHAMVVTASTVTGTLGATVVDAAVVAHARDVLGGASGMATVAGREVFFDVFEPPPQLLVVSAGDDVMPLARTAADVGFRVVIADRRPALLTRARFPGAQRLVEVDATTLVELVASRGECYAVVMSHNYADDRAYLRALLDSRAMYIGMLGPRQRTERMLAELSAEGPVDESRVYGPVGLDIGTDGAEQVALAVIGEILAVRSGRSPTSLRERQAPIHAGTTD